MIRQSYTRDNKVNGRQGYPYPRCKDLMIPDVVEFEVSKFMGKDEGENVPVSHGGIQKPSGHHDPIIGGECGLNLGLVPNAVFYCRQGIPVIREHSAKVVADKGFRRMTGGVINSAMVGAGSKQKQAQNEYPFHGSTSMKSILSLFENVKSGVFCHA